MACNMRDVYNENLGKTHEEVLRELRMFILSQAESFRNGEITEEQFYVNTYVRKDLLCMIMELNEGISINSYYNVSIKDLNDFVAAYRHWKDSGKTEYKQWMLKVINTKGNIIEATEWVFRVIDALLYPIGIFICHDPRDYKIPMILNCYSGNKVQMLIDDYLMLDKVMKFDKMFTVGESYHLRYRSGIEADIMINGFSGGEYDASGIIYGYMTNRQKMKICEIDGRVRILFNERTFSAYQIAMSTMFYPIPHPEWNRFNEEDLKRSYQNEAEYKALRLPYMLGAVTKDQISGGTSDDGGSSEHGGKIISFSDLTNK